MWDWVLVALVGCTLLLYPANVRWWLLMVCVLQLSVVPARMIRCSFGFSRRENLLLILRLVAALLMLMAVALFVRIEEEWKAVAIFTAIPLLYGVILYYDQSEQTAQWANPRFRAFRVWDLMHDYYGLTVWRQRDRPRPRSNSVLARLHRLWQVSSDRDLFYRCKPVESDRYEENSSLPSSIWIAYPYGSRSISTIVAFGFYGSTPPGVQAPGASRVLVMLDASHFRVPLMREMLLLGGCVAYSKPVLEKLLKEGWHIVLSLGLYQSTLESSESQIAHALAVADENNYDVLPVAVLGEQGCAPRFGRILWDRTGCHLPMPGLPAWTSEHTLLIGTPVNQHLARTVDNFYHSWLCLFDEGRCAIRKCERYHLAEADMEGSDSGRGDTLLALRERLGHPLIDRKRLFIS